MAYSSDVAGLLAAQLAKFVTLNRHQLAGQVANLDFWLDEVVHALAVVDGYGRRFRRMKAAQERHVAAHGTVEFEFWDPADTTRKASSPRRVPDAELKDARSALCEATYRFLVRCCHDGMIDERTARSACERIGIGVEANDLRVKR
jgi:hypothetical protein